MKRIWLCLVFLLLAVHPVRAETRSVSYAIWNVVNESVYVRFMLPESEAQRLATANIPYPSTKTVADYILPHLSAARGGKPCEAIDQGQGIGKINTLAMTPGMLRYEVIFRCPDGKGLTLSNTAFFDKANGHIHYGALQTPSGGVVMHVFTAGSPSWELPDTNAASGSSVFRFWELGFSHALNSLDILLFLLSIMLVARTRRDYLLGLCGIAAGALSALLLTSFELAGLPAYEMSSFKALPIVFVAAAAMLSGFHSEKRGRYVLAGFGAALMALAYVLRGWPAALVFLGLAAAWGGALASPKPETRRTILIVSATYLFGLIDGFLLPAELSQLPLSETQSAFATLGFAAGTITAEAAVPLAIMTARNLVPVFKRIFSVQAFLPDLAGAACLGMGVFWFVNGL